MSKLIKCQNKNRKGKVRKTAGFLIGNAIHIAKIRIDLQGLNYQPWQSS